MTFDFRRLSSRVATLGGGRPLSVLRACKRHLHVRAQFYGYVRRYGPARPRPHAAPGELIVSLTSYPPRYPTLHLTLKSLLRQNAKADRVILWIAAGDERSLPGSTRRLLGKGVELAVVDDVRSYKKLVFALQQFPDAYIATADDDVFYKPDWLETLVGGLEPAAPAITCHRAHRLKASSRGTVADYLSWDWDVQDERARRPSGDILPTGLGGVLYPPRSLHPDVVDRTLFERFAPSADDLWFFWCARRAGSAYRKVGGPFELLNWWSSQEVKLFDANRTENNKQIADLVSRFGDPTAMPIGADRDRNP